MQTVNFWNDLSRHEAPVASGTGQRHPTSQGVEEKPGTSLVKPRFPILPFLIGFYPGKSSKGGIQLLKLSSVKMFRCDLIDQTNFIPAGKKKVL